MKIKCPACAAVLNIPESAAGKVVKCPCGKQLRAPAPAAASRPGTAAGRPTAAAAARPAARPPAAAAGGFDPGIFDELTDQDLEPVKSVGQPGAAVAGPSAAGGKLMQQYAPTGDSRGGVRSNAEIAGVGRRIMGVLVDGLFYMLVVMIGVGVAMAVAGPVDPDQADGEFGLFHFIVLGFYVLPTIVNAVLISMSGQSLGKKVVGTVMVNQDSRQPVGFVHGFLIRSVGFGFLTGIPFVGFIIAVVDLIFLFRADHQTLHDKLAQTLVVQK